MKYLPCCLFIILLACSQSRTSSVESVESAPDTTETPLLADDPVTLVDDSSLYVGPVSAFDETAEFYTPVYALENKDVNFEHLSSQVDSVIFKGDEVTRSRLPLRIAIQHFNLSGLKRISVYNEGGQLITDAVFVRVELWDGPIESQFIAVFKPMIPSWYTNDISYCTTASPDSFQATDAATKELHDQELTASLLQRFEIDSTKVWAVHHLQFLNDNRIWSVIATDPGSILVETTGEELTLLNQIKEDYSMMEVTPLPIDMNGKPMLLATMAVNETDMIWTSLLVYRAHGYEVVPDGRIR